MTRWMILDRDGVINRDAPDFVKSLAEWQPLPGSIAAIAKLSRAGYRVAIATNQSGVGRGVIRSEDLYAMHAELCLQVARAGGVIDGIFYCPHAPEADCGCRKPRTGLLAPPPPPFPIPLRGPPAVGARLPPFEAARPPRCLPVLVRTGNGRATEMRLTTAALHDLPVYDDLAAVADALVDPQL